jgi:hypothetical protein
MFRQPNVVGDGTTRRCGEVSGETCAAGELSRSQSLHGTAAVVSRAKRRKQSCAEGREAGRWIGEFHREAKRKPSVGSAREGYTRRRDPRERLDMGGSHGVERAHVGGAGKRRQRREMV